ncbi:hypothetical protein BU26DRAFT_606250 [Trematosphaeria pertusa]|uniref:Uncharacterized protein n=1 Tax=Trematosphaeria pertusa TaxID=390896 RepID=A0A6A6IB32_9PLEO|nr:uncharacterized protein BU26DRAFT_606250 [Trematosphaeria pertusa]KAF2247268.1 hypothetical protein BU26DRAFT_606250 [Trematosphaeria pertusa]
MSNTNRRSHAVVYITTTLYFPTFTSPSEFTLLFFPHSCTCHTYIIVSQQDRYHQTTWTQPPTNMSAQASDQTPKKTIIYQAIITFPKEEPDDEPYIYDPTSAARDSTVAKGEKKSSKLSLSKILPGHAERKAKREAEGAAKQPTNDAETEKALNEHAKSVAKEVRNFDPNTDQFFLRLCREDVGRYSATVWAGNDDSGRELHTEECSSPADAMGMLIQGLKKRQDE